jgi:hypothetical protein
VTNSSISTTNPFPCASAVRPIYPRTGQSFKSLCTTPMFLIIGRDPVSKLSGGQVLIKRNSKEIWREVVLKPWSLHTISIWYQSPGGAHLQLFGGRGQIGKTCSRHYRINHLTSINVHIEHPDNCNVLIAGRILGNQQAKVGWSLVTP